MVFRGQPGVAADLDKIVAFIEKLKHERDEEIDASRNYRSLAIEAQSIGLIMTGKKILEISHDEARHSARLQMSIEAIVKRYSL